MENEIIVRNAVIGDIPQIVEVEKAAWGENGAATKKMFLSRIETFPEGTFVACKGNKIIGVIVTEIVNYDIEKDSYSWYDITDYGFIKKSHNPEGDTLYGVDLSVHPDFQRNGVGKKLYQSVIILTINKNLKKGLYGARIPNYYKYQAIISPAEYIKINKHDQSRQIPQDPELSFYLKAYHGSEFKIKKLIPNYFKDRESLNYGVLIGWENIHYRN